MARFFLEPRNDVHRRYEALRAFYVEDLRSAEAARQFGYTPGAFRVLCHRFRKNPTQEFFTPPKRRPGRVPKMVAARSAVIEMRKQNQSVYDISRALAGSTHPLTPAAISSILQDEGFSKLPRRRDEERTRGAEPTTAAVADVRTLSLEPRTLHTMYGGIFLFVADLVASGLDGLLSKIGFPGSDMVPAGHGIRSLLALKLVGTARRRHVMSEVLDDGLALFAGLNVIPKRSYLTVYSTRIEPLMCRKLMAGWSDSMHRLGLETSGSFNLDFHTIPFHGEDALIEKHYVSKRSRRQKGLLAFVVQDEDGRLFCYANGDVRKDEHSEEVIRFVRYWKRRTGVYPKELVFDSQLTTHYNLNRLNRLKIPFITLQRRSEDMLDEARNAPPGAWKRIELENVGRAYRTPKVLDQKVDLSDYSGKIRRLIIDDLGHEDPTFLVTNQMKRSRTELVDRYARRMVIENCIADGIDFFHMDALSAWVPMRVDLDLKLTLMASGLYRLLAYRLGNGYKTAKTRTLYQRFVDAAATINVTEQEIIVKFQKRANNPLLRAADVEKATAPVPWLGNRRLRIELGERGDPVGSPKC